MTAHIPVGLRARPTPVRRTLFVLPTALILTGGSCFWAASAAPAADRPLVAWCAGAAAVLLTAAVTSAAYALETARHLRARIAGLEASAVELAEETLPSVVERVRNGVSVDTAVAQVRNPGSDAYTRILRTAAYEIGQGERKRAAALSVCATAAGRVQAMATSMHADLREMEHRHGEEVLDDLLNLDHGTAQTGRLADSIAVLTGARSGRRWTKPIVMESILRGALGRISAYQRVQLHSSSTVSIVGHAAEGIMHALAELLDNATSFSAPPAEVHVYVEEVHTGVVITVEDSGLGMSEIWLRRAERAVSEEPLDLATLATGTRLGFAVVGCLARKHGLSVSFRPSSRGGTGVVMMVPQSLVSQSVSKPVHAPAVKAQTVLTPVPKERGPEQAADTAPHADTNLPKRRRGQTFAAAESKPADPKPRPLRSASESGARFGSFRKAAQGADPSNLSRPEGDT